MIKDIMESFSDLNIDEIDVPKFYFPKDLIMDEIKIDFGKRIILIPTKQNGYVKFKKKRVKIELTIEKSGCVDFRIYDSFLYIFTCDRSLMHCYSTAYSKEDRIFTLILFEQLNNEIYQRLNEMISEHNNAVGMMRKALKVFASDIVADKLSE